MGNLMKYTASDLPQLLDRINRNSIGMDEYFDRLFRSARNDDKLSSI